MKYTYSFCLLLLLTSCASKVQPHEQQPLYKLLSESAKSRYINLKPGMKVSFFFIVDKVNTKNKSAFAVILPDDTNINEFENLKRPEYFVHLEDFPEHIKNAGIYHCEGILKPLSKNLPGEKEYFEMVCYQACRVNVEKLRQIYPRN